ncbi:unnamed protein product [Diplocarpon coronariae]|nr:hypothetical protein JHW43_001685 [Diplocarpon mali]
MASARRNVQMVPETLTASKAPGDDDGESAAASHAGERAPSSFRTHRTAFEMASTPRLVPTDQTISRSCLSLTLPCRDAQACPVIMLLSKSNQSLPLDSRLQAAWVQMQQSLVTVLAAASPVQEDAGVIVSHEDTVAPVAEPQRLGSPGSPRVDPITVEPHTCALMCN